MSGKIQREIQHCRLTRPILVAAYCCDAKQERSRLFLQEHGYIPSMLSKSRFHRRLPQLPATRWQALFYLRAQVHQQNNREGAWIVESCPVPVCDTKRFDAVSS